MITSSSWMWDRLVETQFPRFRHPVMFEGCFRQFEAYNKLGFFYRCLEEGAEEFFLKPVRLSDVDKLKPYLSKNRRKTNDEEECVSNDKSRVKYDDVEAWSEEERQRFFKDQSC